MTSCVAAGNGSLSEQLYRGIAYQANLVLVKTGNPEGRGIREVDIQRALAWVLANYQRFNIKIINISLGGDHPANGKLSELDQLVEEAVDCGIVVVTAAGNDGAERLVSPASAPSAITVGGLDSRNTYDRRLWQLYHSNYGWADQHPAQARNLSARRLAGCADAAAHPGLQRGRVPVAGWTRRSINCCKTTGRPQPTGQTSRTRSLRPCARGCASA